MQRLVLIFSLFGLLACSDNSPTQTTGDYDPSEDYFSFANTSAFVTEHLALDLEVDFPAQRLTGTATLSMRNLHPMVRTIVLDTRDLEILGASVGRPGEAANQASFSYGQSNELMGQALEIELPDGFDPQGGFDLVISYHTSPGATALQWLPAELTTSGEHPLMFSQSQSIHARSWIPLQDTPAMRITYEAVIKTPAELLAVMSADNDPEAARSGEYRFEMPQPIPSYLMAIAVGDFYFSAIGEETGVYAEKQLLQDSAYEFAETQDMLEQAETMFGPYDWGRYDLLILPYSFPYGGMENPRLSFITPSLLAGDRSLVSLIAHELAHSWSGNLVSNRTWRDIWINEGTTSYLEARLMEALFGKERTDEERVLNYNALVEGMAEVADRYQALAPKMDRDDDMDGQNGVEYIKGQFFLEHMERLFGRKVFDAYMQGYFKHFAWQSISSEQFLEYLDEHLIRKNPGVFTREQAEQWLYGPGIPGDFQPPTSKNLDSAAEMAVSWASGEVPTSGLAFDTWSPQAGVQFLNYLPAEVDEQQLQELDEVLGLSTTRNAEIGRAWFIEVANRRFEPAYPAMREHLQRHGRMRLVTPVYRALNDNGQDGALAAEIFDTARSGYHPLTVQSVEEVITAE